VRSRSRAPKPQPIQHAAERHVDEPTLAAVVREQTGLPWSRARALCFDGRVTLDGVRCIDPAARVAPGSEVVVDEQARRLRTGPLPESAIVFADRDVVVVDKPAGMLSAPDEPGAKGTLADYARTVLRALGRGPDAALSVVHRLDRDTSGLVVLARNAAAKRHLAAQFRAHTIERVYLAIAHGDVRAARVDSMLVPDRGDGLRGSHGHFRRARGDAPPVAKHAVTNVLPIAPLAGATLVECRLGTGRQHQIRIHLAELGHPLVGERVYVRDYAGARIEAPRTMLHARTLGFAHPRTGENVVLESEPPADFRAMVEALRAPGCAIERIRSGELPAAGML
jgi:23S rRNA pseudouridine1911/1915/1917 synthase